MPAFNMPALKISHKLIGGFAAVVLLLTAAVGTTLWEVKGVKNLSDRIVHMRTPTAEASASLTREIYASLADLRGWMLTGNTIFKHERATAWKEIAETRAEMDKLSKNWTNPKNVSAWADFKATLDEFAAAQDKVEAIANSVDEQPATKMLVDEAAPLAGVMVQKITEMIDLELSGSQVTNEMGNRVQFLGIMADVRGTLGLGLANIRAYLLTGNKKFVEKFETLWAKNDRRFADLKNAVSQMSPAQRQAFDAFAEKRGEFVPLPPKLFAIRGSKKWNMANYTLVKEAAPRANKLLTTLLGPESEDGSRSGGMVANQKKLMHVDAKTNEENIATLLTTQWVLLALGLAAGGGIAFFTMRSISQPLIRMTGAMKQLADGDLETEVPGQDRKDEIGDMSGAVQVFKENAVRNKQLEKEQEEKRQVEEKRQSVIAAATTEFDASVSGIVETVSSASTELNSTAQSMSSIAEETSSQATAVAAASEEASANVQTVASATEEMTASISEINTQVAQASEVSKQAVENVAKTSVQMDELAKTADK
ncbi:MAG: MCP four helix bundle domain-containing protein, partial [Alphaproteobacteria bacterium]